tara:strand:- start:53 stop:172 length:120 start_codon:yes stop_codon:yes gene_type:complete
MIIRDWEAVALIVVTGDIGNCMSYYLTTNPPGLDVHVCG